VRKKPKLICVADTTTLKEAMQILSSCNLLSLPVVNEEKQEFYGFVDVLDLAGYILAEWKRISVRLESSHFPAESLFETEIFEIVNFSNMNYPIYIREDASIQDAIKLFCRPRTVNRLHRIGVVNENGKLVNVISQSDIIYFAVKHIDTIPKSLVDLPIGTDQGLIKSPIMVRIDSPFSDTLETLYKNKISGLALVDHEFKLCGNLSASDLRGMNSLGFDFFLGSTLQFLVKGTQSKLKRTQSVQPGDTFGSVLLLLEKERIHRVYITDQSGHPIGFISLIDLISRFPD